MEQWRFELLHCSENATFLVTEPEHEKDGLAAGAGLVSDARKRVMRVARPGYHTLEELESEIRWVEKIWEEKVVPVARPVRNRCGDGVTVSASFSCVMFEFIPGHAPDPKHDACALDDFREIGRMAAKLHEQVICWPEAEKLCRPQWDYEHMLGAKDCSETGGCAGNWMKLVFRSSSVSVKKSGKIWSIMEKKGRIMGLIHSDLRAANLLKDEHCIHAIDFDDSGFGWFLYDAAAAISFVEYDKRAGEWLSSWVNGYREVRPLSPEEAHLIPTFVMARRIQLMAWITSHDDSDPVKVYYRGFAGETVKMGERFLLGNPDFFQLYQEN